MAVLVERVMVVLIVLMSNGMVFVEKVMERLARMLLKEVHHNLGHMQPFVQFQRAERVETESDHKQKAAHGPGKGTSQSAPTEAIDG